MRVGENGKSDIVIQELEKGVEYCGAKDEVFVGRQVLVDRVNDEEERVVVVREDEGVRAR